jgi:sugar lactone lactonase YvrE
MLHKNSAKLPIVVAFGFVGLVAFLSVGTLAQSPYRVEPFGVLPSGIELVDGSWGDVPGIAADKNGKIIALRRAEPPIVELDGQTGKVLKMWGTGLFGAPHGLYIDRQGFIWATDAAYKADATPEQKAKAQRVMKFSPEGKLLMTLGKAGVAGDGPDTFNQPSGVVVGPNGDIFVADGHGGANSNARIVRFTKDGKFIKAWGRQGSGPGEFNAPHAIAMDSQGRIFVADRSNQRIQIFDQEGTLLDTWKQFGGVSGLVITPDDKLYAANASDNSPVRGVVIGDAKTGKVLKVVTEEFPDCIAVTPNGMLYVGEADAHRTKQPLKRLVPIAVPAEVLFRSPASFRDSD